MNHSITALEAIKKTLPQDVRHYGAGESSPPAIVAVSKTFGPEAVLPLLDAGHRIFGENRVQEAEQKWPALKAKYPDIELHLIGPLQTNKVKAALLLFDVIETLDRPKLADALKKEFESLSGKMLEKEFLIQVNTGEEAQKSGTAPQETGDFIHYCRDELKLPVTGLMCIPPASDNPAPHFALLRALAERHRLTELSMGMSSDYAVAAALGATHIRIGSAVFGHRH